MGTYIEYMLCMDVYTIGSMQYMGCYGNNNYIANVAITFSFCIHVLFLIAVYCSIGGFVAFYIVLNKWCHAAPAIPSIQSVIITKVSTMIIKTTNGHNKF